MNVLYYMWLYYILLYGLYDYYDIPYTILYYTTALLYCTTTYYDHHVIVYFIVRTSALYYSGASRVRSELRLVREREREREREQSSLSQTPPCIVRYVSPACPCPVRPISLLTLPVLTLLDSNFPGNPLWTWEFHPFKFRLCLSQTPWNPQC